MVLKTFMRCVILSLMALFAAVVVAICSYVCVPQIVLAQEDSDTAQTEVYLVPSEDIASNEDTQNASASTTTVTNSDLSKTGNNSKTGDNALLLPFALIGVSAAIIAGVLVSRKVAASRKAGRGGNK